jgi:hypothetical protein
VMQITPVFEELAGVVLEVGVVGFGQFLGQ